MLNWYWSSRVSQLNNVKNVELLHEEISDIIIISTTNDVKWQKFFKMEYISGDWVTKYDGELKPAHHDSH